MNIIVSGSSGLLGTALTRSLHERGDRVRRLVRQEPREDSEILWDPLAEGPAEDRRLGDEFSSCDAVVHLAGVSIGDKRWNQERKRQIWDSRISGTARIARAAAASGKVGVLVSSSAIGYFGDSGESVVDESSPRGSGFLAELCEAWEAAAQPARDAGWRVVNFRTSLVLTAAGGALPKMLPPFKMGVGGVIGSGKQWWSWISLEDWVRAVVFALDDASLAGPVVAAAPGVVRNSEFTRALAGALRRPAFLPLPGFAAKLIVGEMAEEALLAGQRTRPTKLLEAGFQFRHADLRGALEAVL
jgi:uncharacterized protein (TIGR01777 family)